MAPELRLATLSDVERNCVTENEDSLVDVGR